MVELMSFPAYAGSVEEYKGPAELAESCRALCDGAEVIWGGDDALERFPPGLALGYHLLFYADWVDFWRGDEKALRQKFGSRAAWAAFYGGEDRRALVAQYRADLDRAVRLGARYVVFHVSDVSIEEGYTYRWEHTCEEVIDAAAELLNELTRGRDFPFSVLLENQWWPGFTFTDPELTARLLEAVRFPNKGLLLDTGHLLNANQDLETEAQGIAYLHRMLDIHGELAREIRGMHLHKSLSGGYVKSHTGILPQGLPEDYLARFAGSYGHILQIDRHEPWTDGAIRSVVERIAPDYLTHELAASNRAERERAVRLQRAVLWKGEPQWVNG